jgi:hypothetical protein
MLEIGDHFGDGRRSDFELRSSFRHAATSGDREEDMQVAQLQSSAELVFPIDFSAFGKPLRGLGEQGIPPKTKTRLAWQSSGTTASTREKALNIAPA